MELIDQFDVIIIPVANPDGYAHSFSKAYSPLIHISHNLNIYYRTDYGERLGRATKPSVGK